MRARRSWLAAGAVAACVWAGPAAAAPVATIVIDKMAFGPAPKGLRVGQVVAWDNRDVLQHTATARGGGFDLMLKPGGKGQTKLKRAGRIAVYCRYHPGMTLMLNVAK